MNQHPEHSEHPGAPGALRLTEDELWYLGFLKFAEECNAEGVLAVHSRPLGLVWRLQVSLADLGLVRYVGPREPIPVVELTEAGRAVDPDTEPDDHPPGIYPDEVPEMEVCHDCGQVVGRFFLAPRQFRVQYGRCPVHAAPEAVASEWPGYDFRLHVDLCRCCGRVPLQSGSRWSVWFCQACKEQVGLLNGRHGRCIVPIGRHSVHAGHLLSGEQAGDPVAVEGLLSTMKALGRVHELLHEWVREAVRRNFRDVGFAPDRPVPLEAYWLAVRTGVDPDQRFRELCAYLEQASRVEAERRSDQGDRP